MIGHSFTSSDCWDMIGAPIVFWGRGTRRRDNKSLPSELRKLEPIQRAPNWRKWSCN